MIDPQRVWSSAQLPTLPGVAVRLLELMRRRDGDLRDVIDVVRADPAISAKLLKLANSSFCGHRSQVTSVERAVPLLGTTVVTSVALSFSLVEAAMPSGPLASHYRRYWLEALVQAAAAEVLGRHAGAGGDGAGFQAGLLTDIGRLALLRTLADSYRPVLQAAESRPLHEVEREVFGFSHVEVGVQLATSWNLPSSLTEAVRWHHASPEELRRQAGGGEASLVPLAALAAAAADGICSPHKPLSLERLKQLTGEWLPSASARLEGLLAEIRTRAAELGKLLSIEAGPAAGHSELLSEANEQLAQLAVRAHIAGTQALARQQQAEREKRELESRHEVLRHQALRDPLTQLYNRHFFDETLRNELRRCGRVGAPAGLIFLDVDHFKQINDTHGHSVGDQVLTQVARRLTALARKSDVLARYGGEEFVLLAPHVTERGLHKLAERIRAGIESELVECEGTRVAVTVSVGAAIAFPGKEDNALPERLVSSADEAMYEAKRSGRNQVRLRCLMDDRQRRTLQQVAQKRFSRWLVNRQVIDVPSVSRALLEMEGPRLRLGDLAIQQGRLTREQVAGILAAQSQTSERFGDAAIRLGLLDEEQMVQLLALQQEEPVALARALVRLGLLERKQAAILLTEYLSQTSARVGDRWPAAQEAPAAT